MIRKNDTDITIQLQNQTTTKPKDSFTYLGTPIQKERKNKAEIHNRSDLTRQGDSLRPLMFCFNMKRIIEEMRNLYHEYRVGKE